MEKERRLSRFCKTVLLKHNVVFYSQSLQISLPWLDASVSLVYDQLHMERKLFKHSLAAWKSDVDLQGK